MRAGICLLIGWMLITLVLPLWALLSKSFQNQNGEFVGLANYIHYFSTPALFASVWNSLFVSIVSTAIVLPLAFVYAYALQRSCMRWKGLFQALALIPILAPSLLPAISLIYLFGNQGFLKGLMFGGSIYGAGGIIISQVFYCFPHALMILVAALSMADARLYEAAEALGASKTRVFFTVTLPGAKYGVISAGFVIFTLVITDFGIAKVIGGQLQRARHRHLQAGDRPAELRDGRGGRLRPADSGRASPSPPTASSSAGRWRCCRRAPCRSSRSRRRGATGCCSRSAPSSAA